MQTSLAYIFSVVSALLVGQQKTSQFQCGVRQIKHIETIVNGEVTSPGDWPWHAAIFHKRGHSLDYACGGTLISENHVLTAEHCVSAPNGRQMQVWNILVRLGLHNLHLTQNVQTHEVDRIVRYVGTAEHVAKRNDIALIELKSVADRTAYVQPACVNQVENIAGRIGTIVGWGRTEEEVLSDTLRSTRLLIRTTDECIEANDEVFGPAWHTGIFCAGYTNGTNACNGDSGGGLFLSRDNVWYLTGIISFTEKSSDGNTCKRDGYTAFTRISKYLTWIQNNINSFSSVYSPFPRNCGMYQINRISRGQKANIYEFPWMALIKKRSKKPNKLLLAPGTLISKRYILTSSYAATGVNISVTLGEHTRSQTRDCNLNDPTDCAPPIEEYPIDPKDIKFHEDDDEIALIRLGRDVTFKDHIQPICLPTTPALSQLSLPQYVVTDWGRNQTAGAKSSFDVLHKATIRAVDFERCKAIYAEDDIENELPDDYFCAGGDEYGPDVCGSGGTPIGYIAQHEAGLRFVQFGFVAIWPRKCGDFPSAYLKVANYMGWIVLNMKP